MSEPLASSSGQADPGSPGASSRRGFLLGAVGMGAAGAGGALAWWRLRPGPAADGAVAALWAQSFQTPEGQALDMASLRGQKVLLNFWATWCPPCVEEMPLLDRFHRENSSSGWKVVGLAIDQPSSVRAFLGRIPISFPIGLAGLGGTDLVRSLGNAGGGLPFTVVIDGKGQIRQRKMGQVSPAELADWRSTLG